MKKLSGTIISHNEEAKIEAALQSLAQVCDEVLVVDSFSSDRTVEICEASGASVHQCEWPGYAVQKQRAAELAEHDWILSLDADERLSGALIRELEAWKKEAEPREGGYLLPRKTFFMGRWILHTCWYPDSQLRLFHRHFGEWQGKYLHEGVRLRGRPAGQFLGHIDHYTYASISEYLQQLDRFSDLAAREYRERGRRSSLVRLTAYPVGMFIKNWIIKRGFQDGLPGFVVSVLAGVSTFFNYLKLRELEAGNDWRADWLKASSGDEERSRRNRR